MYVVPIFERVLNSMEDICIKQVWTLLERNGTYCSSVETVEDAVAYATENEIPLNGPPVVSSHFIFLPVDSTSTLLDTFYTWNETQPDEQPMRTVWRPFVWISKCSCKDVWGTNVYLKDINIGNNLSIFELVNEYFETTLPVPLSAAMPA
jgi:hypothetical protein